MILKLKKTTCICAMDMVPSHSSRLIQSTLVLLVSIAVCLQPAIAADCNNDGIQDDQQLVIDVDLRSGPIGGFEVVSHTFENVPGALGDVSVEVIATTQLSSLPEHYGDLYINGVYFGRHYETNGGVCISTSTFITIDASTWESLRVIGEGDLHFEMRFSLAGIGCGTEDAIFNADFQASNDCDGDGLLNECETEDCDGNGVFDGCETDADADGTIDACDPCPCGCADSDNDTIGDACDVCPGADDTIDCNGDGTPDCTQLEGSFNTTVDGPISPPCVPDGETVMMISGRPPLAGSDVSLDLEVGWANIDDPTEWIDLTANGQYLGRFFERPLTCDNTDTIIVPAATWNAVLAADPARNVELRILRNAASCGGTSTCPFSPPLAFCTVAYTFDNDLNDNGWIDTCIPDCNPFGPDTDSDGVSDECDQCPSTIAGHPYVDELGCPYYASPADFDRDGDVDATDTDAFFTCQAGPDVIPTNPGPCSSLDFLLDSDVDLHDYLALQDAASPSGMLAEIESAGGVAPNYLLVDDYVNGVGSAIDWFAADDHCETHFETNLATVDPQLSAVEEQARIDEMTALSIGLGDSWIGLRYSSGPLTNPQVNFIGPDLFQWVTGPLLEPSPIGTSVTNWALGLSPDFNDFLLNQTDKCVTLYAADGHRWLNAECEGGGGVGFDVQSWICDAPPVVAGSEDQLVPAALDLQIVSDGSSSVEVEAGANVSYLVHGQLDNTINLGLAGFAFDLSFDGGALSPADTPTGGPLNQFAAPLGHNNPGGFGGTVSNGDLLQVGGGQNTLDYTGSNGPTGSVVTLIGHSQEVLATGSLVAPIAPGTYTLTLGNVIATTINAGETGPGIYRCEPTIAGSVTNLTITVVPCSDSDADGVCDPDDICPGFDDNVDTDVDGLPNGCDTCAGGAASGDSDASSSVDLIDFEAMATCLTGPDNGSGDGCECFDFDSDDDVDMFDYADFQLKFANP